MVVQVVVVYSEVASGANVVNVVNDVPDWLTAPELVTTEPSGGSSGGGVFRSGR